VAEADLDGLAKAAAAGDAHAMHDLLRAAEPAVLRVCSRILPYRQDAEEACQDALVQVAARIGTFEGRSRFSTWLYVVATNSARGTYRSLRRRAAERPGVEHADRPDPRTTSVIAGTRLDLLEALDALEAGSSGLAAVLVLRDVAGLEYAQVAQHLGLPLGTVKSRIHEARQRIRPLLGGR
jgi:RNA polymerase sigma-70 factor (ECF subfamily)